MSDPEQPQADEHVGHSIGPYRVEALLGVGGMGRVYKAVNPEGDEVALKLVKADLASDEIFRRRFDREVRIARTVVHLHVVPVIDSGEHEGIPYMAQKYVGNGTLEDLVQKEQTLDLDSAVKICNQVAIGGAPW